MGIARIREIIDKLFLSRGNSKTSISNHGVSTQALEKVDDVERYIDLIPSRDVLDGFDVLKEYCEGSISESITIKDVYQVGIDAFKSSNVKYVNTNSPAIKKIESGAFTDCTNLRGIEIGTAVTYIGGSTFANTGLEEITIPNNVKNIGASCFMNCSSLKSVKMPETLANLYNSMFRNCSSLKEIKLPTGFTVLGNYTFENCTSLEEIEIPSGVKTIANSVFQGCTSLKNVTIPETVTLIQNSAFNGCTSLTEITLPSSLKILNGNIFRSCTALKEVVIPDSVTTMGASNFYDATALERVVLPVSLTSIGNYNFANTTSLKVIEYKGTVAQFDAITKGPNWSGLMTPTTVIQCTDGVFAWS